MSDRSLSFGVEDNLRDLGGLVTPAGRRVRRGRLYRSAFPSFAADADHVRSLGLRTVVDLRRPDEIVQECIVWRDQGVEHRPSVLVGRRHSTSWYTPYSAYLASGPRELADALVFLMDPDNHPALFHCAAGKDRTGVVAAMLLAVLGLSKETIAEDFHLSRQPMDQIITRLRALPPYVGTLGDTDLSEHHPQQERLDELLAYLSERGGAVEWLLANGVTRATIERFRESTLQD